jgi:hypothetical protein
MEQWAVERQKVEDLVLKASREKTPESREEARQAIQEWEAKHPDKGPLIAFKAMLDR